MEQPSSIVHEIDEQDDIVALRLKGNLNCQPIDFQTTKDIRKALDDTMAAGFKLFLVDIREVGTVIGDGRGLFLGVFSGLLDSATVKLAFWGIDPTREGRDDLNRYVRLWSNWLDVFATRAEALAYLRSDEPPRTVMLLMHTP